MSELAWRPVTPGDAAGVRELFLVVARTAPIGLETELAEVGGRLSSPRLDPQQDTLIGTDSSGRVVAYAECADMGVGNGRLRIRLTNVVHPEAGQHVNRRTHQWLLDRARQLHRQCRPDLPGVMGARCAATDDARLSVLTETGFEIAGWHRDLVRPTERSIPPAPAPEGVMITPFHPRYDQAAWRAHNEAHADMPGALLPDAENWPLHATGLPTFLPAASFLAFAGDPAGHDIAAFLFSLAQRDITGVREAALTCMGTRPQWRRRGLASALLTHSLAAYRDAGLGQVRLQVNGGNTAAVNLYDRYGFADSGRGYASLHLPFS